MLRKACAWNININTNIDVVYCLYFIHTNVMAIIDTKMKVFMKSSKVKIAILITVNSEMARNRLHLNVLVSLILLACLLKLMAHSTFIWPFDVAYIISYPKLITAITSSFRFSFMRSSGNTADSNDRHKTIVCNENAAYKITCEIMAITFNVGRDRLT